MTTLNDAVKVVREGGLRNLKAAQSKQKVQYDLKHKGALCDIGEQVLHKNCRRDTRLGDKLIFRCDGPFQIAESLGKGSYKLRDIQSGEVLKQTYASTRLKR
jgi:hypothetical protein